MEALVLCPEELCLGPAAAPGAGENLSIWTNESVEKGTRFLPWKGTVRSDKLPLFDKLPEFDVSHCTLGIAQVMEIGTNEVGTVYRYFGSYYIISNNYSLHLKQGL